MGRQSGDSGLHTHTLAIMRNTGSLGTIIKEPAVYKYVQTLLEVLVCFCNLKSDIFFEVEPL